MRHGSVTAAILGLMMSGFCASCSDATRPADQPQTDLPAEFTRSLAAGPAVYVLDHVEQQTSDPIVLFDHMCNGTHYQMISRDTLVLYADGTARRSTYLANQMNGVESPGDQTASSGRWVPFLARNYYYFSDGPSITVDMTQPKGEAVSYQLRINDPAHISFPGALGGSCPGSANDGREAVFTYTRR